MSEKEDENNQLYKAVMETMEPMPGFYIEAIVVHAIWNPNDESVENHEVTSLVWPPQPELAVLTLIHVAEKASEQAGQLLRAALEKYDEEDGEDEL